MLGIHIKMCTVVGNYINTMVGNYINTMVGNYINTMRTTFGFNFDSYQGVKQHIIHINIEAKISCQ